MKVYLTFGQIHAHAVITDHGLKTFDKDCVAVIEAENEEKARDIAFKMFDDKWFTTYTEERFDKKDMDFYPRGFINVNF